MKKLEKKDIILYIIMAGIVVTLAVIFVSDKEDNMATTSPSPSVSPTENPTNSPQASSTSSPQATATPMASQQPGITAEEVRDYNYWFNQLDHQNRVLGIYDECAYMVPSNVAYKNNTLVMLDNTRSQQAVVLKIGKSEYSLGAGAWNTVTLSSQTLPAKMQIFCKGIELGQIDLE